MLTPRDRYKESGIGRECGDSALENYTEIKTVYLNMGMDPIPIGPTKPIETIGH